MSDASSLQLEKRERVAHIIINRPEQKNALNRAMWERFPELLADAVGDDDIRAIQIHASRRQSTFCAGADIEEFSTTLDDPEWRAANQAAISKTMHDLATAPKPTIAIIDGGCVGGGCGLSLACDLRIAGPTARFGITPAKLGLVYSLFDTKLLVDLVGPSEAKHILYTGQLLSAAEAKEIGLITRLSDDPYELADATTASIINASPHSQRITKQIIAQILDGQEDDDAGTRKLFDQAFETDDCKMATTAFLAKRKPEF